MSGCKGGRRGRRALGLGLALALAAGAGCATGGGPSEAERRARSHYNVGVQHLERGRAALAIRAFQAAQDLTPDDGWVLLGLAEAYRRKGHLEEAEHWLDRALELRPRFHQALLNRSALAIQRGRYEQAVELADRLLGDATFPAPWKALTNKGWAQLQLGRVGAARESLEEALDYYGGYWQAELNLGILEARAGSPGKALEHFRRVVELEPGPLAEAEANFRMGEVYASLGERGRAVQHLTAASRARPSGPWGKRSEDTLERLR